MNVLDAQFLSRLLDEHHSVLVLYARQWCDSAEDVVQDSFLQLLRQRNVPDRVVPWLFRVVRNGAISAGRSSRRRGRYEQLAASNRQGWFEADPMNRLDAECAEAALRKLPEQQREAVVARLWGGLSFEEIAELLGTSTSTAHRQYHVALAILRKTLEEDSCLNPKTR